MTDLQKKSRNSAPSELPRSILVVDDEESIRLLLKEYFEILGLEVCITGCGREGLKALEMKKFGLVLCDVSMPGMDGFQFFEQVVKINPRQKLLFISGFGFASSRKKLLEKSLGLLKKPFHLTELNHVLVNVFPELV